MELTLSSPIDASIAPFLPVKHIRTFKDLEAFRASNAYALLTSFVNNVNNSLVQLGASAPEPDAGCTAMLAVLGRIRKLLAAIPPVDEPHRYANPSFRTFHIQFRHHIQEIVEPLKELLGERRLGDVAGYLLDSFGNGTRGDYGTGHETHFVAALAVVHITLRGDTGNPLDFQQNLAPFIEYTRLVMDMQLAYNTEPAGPKGGWAIDLFRIITYMWGSAVLAGQDAPYPEPPEGSLYQISMYFSPSGKPCVSECLKNVHSHCKSWSQINKGVQRMYKGEVVDSFVVMQHFLFGDVFKWDVYLC